MHSPEIVVCAECGMGNPAEADICGLCDKPLNGPLIPITAVVVGQAYAELLMAVERKFPGESRHQTALRYIREAETNARPPQAAAAAGAESTAAGSISHHPDNCC